MIEKDNFWILPVSVLFFMLLLSTLIFGGYLENKRIYDNCLEINSNMVHSELVTKCKDIVK